MSQSDWDEYRKFAVGSHQAVRYSSSMKTTHLALLAALMVGPIVGCFHEHHEDHRDAARDTVIVDENHFEHHGYYDNDHHWHGGYYDAQRAYHDDPADWHHG
jgi:hypothetical protein